VCREVFGNVVEAASGKFYLALLISSDLLRVIVSFGERIFSGALAVFATYLFNAVFDQVADHSRDLQLSDPYNPADGLGFDGGVP
jgi:hypothetical protein